MNIQQFPNGASDLGFVIPLTKIDAEKRLVYGIAAVEEPDRAKEIFDYKTSKPNIEKWSQRYDMATGGMSKGNLRVMHTKTVAGKFNEIGFDDERQLVKVCAHVVDDNEWGKVLSGAYTGFSIGGGYDGPKWDDPVHKGFKRYTADVREISLVDDPCMPSARFAELVKGNFTEQLALTGRIRTFSEIWADQQAAIAAQPKTFAQQWAARPKTFAEMWAGA